MSDNGPTARSKKYRITFIMLLLGFSIYNYMIYTQEPDCDIRLSKNALFGQKIFQDNNCIACHQFYGLGGYLGPDLTNVISRKGEAYTDAFLNSGIKAMPKFNFTKVEKDALIAYLRGIDSTGYYPNPDAKPNNFGWVNIIYKSKIEE